MAKLAKFLQGVAGAGGGAGLNVEEVFSTYLYDGTGSAQTITNDIDLSGEGGLVWVKERTAGGNRHGLYDTERGTGKEISSNLTNAQRTVTQTLTSFNNNGFSIGTDSTVSDNGRDFASWTFRKAPKFFDVVTYTGNGSNRSIAHDLGCEVGMMIVKCTSNLDDWWVYHRGANTSNAGTAAGKLNETAGFDDPSDRWNSTAPTDTHFYLESGSEVNGSGRTYVAYLFAHNDGDGEFGPDADQDAIKCGSFTATAGTEVDLGFEPQFIITKAASTTSDWYMFDTMRGWGADQGSNDAWLEANDSSAEYNNTNSLGITPTGFTSFNGGDATYIYIAIRRGPMAVPESATDVFAVDQGDTTSTPAFNSGFVTDFNFYRNVSSGSDFFTSSRLTGTKYLATNSTAAESSSSSFTWDHMDGFREGTLGTTFYSWMWRRAPSFMDVVAYTGTGSARTINHNLGVAPEMMWVKKRDQAENWLVYHSATGNTKSLRLNSTIAAYTDTNWNNTTPTDSVFSLGSNSVVNYSGHTFIAYLFASLDGISKVGSYTGNGTSQTIDCGFSAGARFVLIKGSSFADNWWVFDTERGIVAGDDPRLYLNTTGAEFSFDYIDPYSSGFTVNSFLSSNGQSYIFYAIA